MPIFVTTEAKIEVQTDNSMANPVAPPSTSFRIVVPFISENTFTKIWDDIVTLNPSDVDIRVDNPLVSTLRLYMKSDQPFMAKFVPAGGSLGATPALLIAANMPVILPAAVGGVYLSGAGYPVSVQCAGLG